MQLRDREVLVTGAGGFIGSRLVARLRRLGARVRGIDLVAGPGVEALDVRQRAAARSVVPAQGLVFHLASVVGVVHVLQRPEECWETSVLGTENLLRAAAERRARIVFTSSSEVYGEGHGRRLAEEDPLPAGYGPWPRASYPEGKRAAEQLLLAATPAQSVRIARLFNVSGPGQDPASGMVLPTFVQQALAGLPMTLVHHGEDLRCFQHVDDAVRGLVRLALHPELDGVVCNLGGEEPISMRALALRVAHCLGVPARLREIPASERYGGPSTRCRQRIPDTTRARDFLGHRPRLPLERLISDLVAEFAALPSPCAASWASRA